LNREIVKSCNEHPFAAPSKLWVRICPGDMLPAFRHEPYFFPTMLVKRTTCRPLGTGHVVLFANNPMWRGETQGSHALVFNAILNWDHLGAKRAPK
jgi:hypothetical protein